MAALIETPGITIKEIKLEMHIVGLPYTGSYDNMPQLIQKNIDTIKHFGESSVGRLGVIAKELVLKLASLDTRKSIICPVTYKNVLV